MICSRLSRRHPPRADRRTQLHLLRCIMLYTLASRESPIMNSWGVFETTKRFRNE
jgi:hypothetical protein